MAKDYQKTRSGLVAINKDQNIVSAGDLSKTKQDVSQWSGKGGLLHNKGWAVCDGSTYDILVFPELDAALGNPVSKVVPNGPYRTKTFNWSDLTFNNTPTGWTERWAYVIFYSDNAGNWRMKFNIGAGITSTTGKVSVGIDGVQFANVGQATGNQPIAFTDNTTGLQKEGGVEGDTNTIAVDLDGSRSFFLVSGDVALESKPTITNFDSYLEDYPIIATANNVLSNSLGLPEATSDGAGLLTLDQNAEGNRNLIINGAFEVNQRGPDSASVSNRHTADRWLINSSGATTLSTIFDDGTNDEFSKYIRLEATTADDNWGWFHRIESVRTLAGKKGTLSFYARSNDSSVANIDIQPFQIFGTGGAPSGNNGLQFTNIPLTNQWVKHEITIDFDEIGSKTIGTDNNDFLSIGFILGDGLNQTGQFDLKLVKLEEGTQASKFTRAGNTYPGELALCQRYYLRINSMPDSFGGNKPSVYDACCVSTTRALGTLDFPSQMRDYPSYTFSALSDFEIAGITPTQMTLRSRTLLSAQLDLNVASGLTDRAAEQVLFVNQNGFIAFDSEL